MKKFFLLALMISFPFFGSCHAQNNDRKRIDLDETQLAYAEAGNDFAFRFLKQIDSCESGDWFVSPVSLQYLLGLVLDGADGETADEICRTLGYPAGQSEAVDAYCRKMLTELPNLDKLTQLKLANAIFFNNKMEIKVPYKKRVEKFYDAAVESLDFYQKQKSLKVINGWCSKQTNGLIPSVLEDVSPDMFAYLLNALYFKGTWMYPFNKKYTRERTFTLESGEKKEIKMMEKERKFGYGEDEICQRVTLPYGNGSYSMIVLLPKKGYTVADVIASYNGENWNEIRTRMGYRSPVNVWLPPFESKYHIKLNDILCDMGMPRSFGPKADFKPMSNDALWLSFVQQDAVIKVDEEGTEAAAVSSAGMLGATAVAEPPRVIDFHCDHPFLYLITENSTGTILFAGKFTGN
ncbi:MAG: serpin family protein [Bacteroidales bacterium]|nr:serpin family protein [Bacteroidales bacterium]